MDTLSIRLTPRLERGRIIIEVQEGDGEPYEVFLKTLRRRVERTPEREPNERLLDALKRLGMSRKGGWVKRRDITRAVQTLKARELGSVLSALVDAGLVEAKEVSTRSDKRHRDYVSVLYRTIYRTI